MPTTISLETSQATFAAGSSFTLTATTNVDVSLSSSTVTITDQVTSGIVRTCSTGTTCALTTTFPSGGPHTYVAQVNSLVSAPVTVSRQAWAVTLTQSGSVYTAGSPVTLTATANQDVGNTSNFYRIYIFNETNGMLLASCSTGSTCSGVPVFYTGGPQVYVAEVAATNGTPTYANVTGQQAVSNEITLTRQAWTVTLTQSGSVYTAGSPVTLTATANQDVGATGGSYRIYIFNKTTGILLASCSTGSTCSGVPVFYTGGPQVYVA
ncbi:MAG: hypothetical protein QOE23_3961, partial [Pseudonocardiales bacterium]|nr:hypothetical protein [Pseudonocardiales bacterium]